LILRKSKNQCRSLFVVPVQSRRVQDRRGRRDADLAGGGGGLVDAQAPAVKRLAGRTLIRFGTVQVAVLHAEQLRGPSTANVTSGAASGTRIPCASTTRNSRWQMSLRRRGAAWCPAAIQGGAPARRSVVQMTQLVPVFIATDRLEHARFRRNFPAENPAIGFGGFFYADPFAVQQQFNLRTIGIAHNNHF